MSHITTFTKKYFDPTAPEIELICIEDIAHDVRFKFKDGAEI